MSASDGALGGATDPKTLQATVNRLAVRWFVLRDMRSPAPVLLHVRTAMSWLRGPLTPAEMRRALSETASSASTGATESQCPHLPPAICGHHPRS